MTRIAVTDFIGMHVLTILLPQEEVLTYSAWNENYSFPPVPLPPVIVESLLTFSPFFYND